LRAKQRENEIRLYRIGKFSSALHRAEVHAVRGEFDETRHRYLFRYSDFAFPGFEQAEVSSQNNGSSLDCLSMIVQSINGPLQPSPENHYSSHH
jgi:hypothetical protein